MYARQLALLALLSVRVPAAPPPGSSDIYVYLRPAIPPAPSLAEEMRQETATLMRAGGYSVHWLNRLLGEVSAAFLVIADLEGDDVSPPAGIHPRPKALAWAEVENGRVLPFAHLNAAGVRRFLSPDLGARPGDERLYGRALGRLLAHELYHIVLQTTCHTANGVSRASVSVEDLVSGEFTFGSEAIEKMRRPLRSAAGPTAGETSSASR
jgi:hypothetical protein